MTLSRLSPMMEWRLVVGTIEVDDNVFPVVQCPPPHTHTHCLALSPALPVYQTLALPPTLFHTPAKVWSPETIVSQLLSLLCGLLLTSQKAHGLLGGRTVPLTASDIELSITYR